MWVVRTSLTRRASLAPLAAKASSCCAVAAQQRAQRETQSTGLSPTSISHRESHDSAHCWRGGSGRCGGGCAPPPPAHGERGRGSAQLPALRAPLPTAAARGSPPSPPRSARRRLLPPGPSRVGRVRRRARAALRLVTTPSGASKAVSSGKGQGKRRMVSAALSLAAERVVEMQRFEVGVGIAPPRGQPEHPLGTR